MHLNLPIREPIRSAHLTAVQSFAKTGTWFFAEERLKILEEFRHANLGLCTLCAERKAALSPYSVNGQHDTKTDLSSTVIEAIHRLTTDSGRVTEKWFNSLISDGLLAEEYIELVGMLATAIVLDTFATGVGRKLAVLPDKIETGVPSRIKCDDVVSEGAWVPISRRDFEDGNSGLPTMPNIVRAMGLVPSAIMEFFGVMLEHYQPTELKGDLSRAQTELIAARTSSYNDCFY